MELKTMSVGTIISILSKTVKNQDDPPAAQVAQNWLNTFTNIDNGTTLTFETSDIENRLCYLLENKKADVLAQLPESTTTVTEECAAVVAPTEPITAETIAPAPPVEQHEMPVVPAAPVQSEQSVSVTAVKETYLPTPQPAVALVAKSKVVDFAPPVQSSSKFPVFFTEPQKVAASFNDMLCNSLEMAFTNINNNQLNQFNIMVSHMAEMQANMNATEARITAKLAAIYNTTCISANNTESMSGMFNTHSTKTKHIPEFTE